MELGIKGKRALVTGASRGLGRAVAIALAREGVKVAVIARDNLALSKVIKEMGGEKAGHFGQALDLMAKNSAKIINGSLKKRFGEIDILVHNLGGTLDIKNPLSDMAEYQRVWQFNTGIAIELNRLFLPQMKQKKWGRIVHVSSCAAEMYDATLPYSSAKAALNAYVRGLGYCVAKDGIIVTAVMPGPFMFSGSHWDNVSKTAPKKFKRFLDGMAIGRLGTPEEISGIIVFLCSRQATFFPGAVIPVDGGIR